MISPKEKRFLKYWEDQKSGGKWQYILIYTIGWSFILFFIPLAVSFLVDVYADLRLYQLPLWAAIVLAIALGFAGSLFFWDRNEGKYKMIREKESSEPVQ